jgi:hypothetical protein
MIMILLLLQEYQSLTGSKAFCCKSEPADPTWLGNWVSGQSGAIMHCVNHGGSRCGTLVCSTESAASDRKPKDASPVLGKSCNLLRPMFSHTYPIAAARGEATYGQIVWLDRFGGLVDVWYKTR